MTGSGFLFQGIDLKPGLISDLGRMNPWWEGNPARPTPPHRRDVVAQINRRLQAGIAPIIVVRGPRQVGKSTAQFHVIEDLFAAGVPARNVFRVQFDDLKELAGLGKEPILRLVDWYERVVLQNKINQVAREGRKIYLLLDEVQNLAGWDVQLKSLVDSSALQVVVTGSSALRIEAGRDSLAGRINTIEIGTLSLTEIATFRGIDLGRPLLTDNHVELLGKKETWIGLREMGLGRQRPRDEAFEAFARGGGYPLVHQRTGVDWPLLADQLNETVIRRVIQHDLRMGDRGRKRDPRLLEELFRLACRYAGQAPSLELFQRESQRVLEANVGVERVRHYLRFLADTLLLRLVEPLEIRLKKKRGAPKVCLADHGLRASWLGEIIPLDPEGLAQEPHLSTLAGHLAESVAGAVLATVPGLDVNWLPERKGEPEVDFVLTVGTSRIPLEVKYQKRIGLSDTEGLRTFIERAVNKAPFGILVTLGDDVKVDDPRIVTLPLSSLMLVR